MSAPYCRHAARSRYVLFHGRSATVLCDPCLERFQRNLLGWAYCHAPRGIPTRRDKVDRLDLVRKNLRAARHALGAAAAHTTQERDQVALGRLICGILDLLESLDARDRVLSGAPPAPSEANP